MDIKEIRKKKIEAALDIAKIISVFEEETGLEVNSILYKREQTKFVSGLFPPVINRMVELEILI